MAKKTQRKRLNQPQKKKNVNKSVSAVGTLLRELGGLGGGLAGGMLGLSGPGSAAGRQLAGSASKWLGFGAYDVKANSLMKVTPTGTIPVMHKSDQTITVSHREYLGEIVGNTSFTVRNSLPLNPGVSSTFPWLSNIAARFQEYRLKGLIFHYVPTSGSAVSSTNAALGSVLFQTSYRAGDAAPSTKLEMLNEYWATEGAPNNEIIHAIECDPRENPFDVHYVRSGQVPAGNDLMLYDMGTTYIAVSGMQASTTVGDLWVTYEVELKKPVVTSAVNEPVKAAAIATTTVPSAPFFQTIANTYGNLEVAVNTAGTGLVFSPGTAGYLYIDMVITSNTGFTSQPNLQYSSISNMVLVNNTYQNSSQQATNVTGYGASTSSQTLLYRIAFYKPDPNTTAALIMQSMGNPGPSTMSVSTTIFSRYSPLW